MSGVGATPHRAVRREEEGVPPHMRGWVSATIRAGAGVGLVALALGLALLAMEDGQRPFIGSTRPTGVLHGLLSAQPQAILLLGLFVLIVTPLARVVVSAALFSAAGDRPFAALTLFVLVFLALSIAVGVLL